MSFKFSFKKPPRDPYACPTVGCCDILMSVIEHLYDKLDPQTNTVIIKDLSLEAWNNRIITLQALVFEQPELFGREKRSPPAEARRETLKLLKHDLQGEKGHH